MREDKKLYTIPVKIVYEAIAGILIHGSKREVAPAAPVPLSHKINKKYIYNKKKTERKSIGKSRRAGMTPPPFF